MEKLFNDLHLLDTHVIDLSYDHVLQISILGLKKDIRKKIKLIDIKDV